MKNIKLAIGIVLFCLVIFNGEQARAQESMSHCDAVRVSVERLLERSVYQEALKQSEETAHSIAIQVLSNGILSFAESEYREVSDYSSCAMKLMDKEIESTSDEIDFSLVYSAIIAQANQDYSKDKKKTGSSQFIASVVHSKRNRNDKAVMYKILACENNYIEQICK